MEHCNGLFCISFGKLSELSYIVLPYELMLLKRIGRSARPCGRMPRRFRNRGVLGEAQLQMGFQATLDRAGEGVRTIRIAYSDVIRARVVNSTDRALWWGLGGLLGEGCAAASQGLEWA